jgi:aminocarboxymuconate-semialdehyde decarboxylase
MASRLADVEVVNTDDGYVLTFPGGKPLRPVAGTMLSHEDRLAWLDGQGLERQLVAPWLDVMGQELPPAAGREWVRALNDALAEDVAGTKDRVLALATVHLGDGAAAAGELERAVGELGLRGCMIPTNSPVGALSDPSYDPLWAVAESMRVPVILHPPTISPSNALFAGRPAAYRGVFGRLIDTTLVAADLVVSGVLDRFPRLEIVLVHGGGFFPYQYNRFAREFVHGSDGAETPPDYLRRFSYDTAMMSPEALTLLFATVGCERVLLGSDYGAQPRYRNSGLQTAALRECASDPAVYDAVVAGNAAKLFALPGSLGSTSAADG